MLLALLIAIGLAGAVLVGARQMRLRYRLAIAVALTIIGLVPAISTIVVGDKPAPDAQPGDIPTSSK